MLVAGGAGLAHARARDLPGHLCAGDVLVVNTSATLPAALPARRADGRCCAWICIDARRRRRARPLGRRAAPRGPALRGRARRRAPRTARRRRRDALAPYLGGARLWLGRSHRHDAVLDFLAEHGAPIRYAHTTGDWPLTDYQTIFALHPGSAEMPSAGRPFMPQLVTALVARGVVVRPDAARGRVVLEAGETPSRRFDVPATTARLVNAARAGGGRVIAVGTPSCARGDRRAAVRPRRGGRRLDAPRRHARLRRARRRRPADPLARPRRVAPQAARGRRRARADRGVLRARR